MPGAGKPQAFNRYSYVLNRPLNLSDPSGHCPGLRADTAGGCIGDDPKLASVNGNPNMRVGTLDTIMETVKQFDIPPELLAAKYDTESQTLHTIRDLKSFLVSLLAINSINGVETTFGQNTDDALLNGFDVPFVGKKIPSPGAANMQVRNILLNSDTRNAMIKAGVKPPDTVSAAAEMLMSEKGGITAMAAHLRGIANVRVGSNALASNMSDVDMGFISAAYVAGIEGWYGSRSQFKVDQMPGPSENGFISNIRGWRNELSSRYGP